MSPCSLTPIMNDVASITDESCNVKFNPALCRYDGLSDIAAKGGANQQYGVPLTSVQRNLLECTRVMDMQVQTAVCKSVFCLLRRKHVNIPVN